MELTQTLHDQATVLLVQAQLARGHHIAQLAQILKHQGALRLLDALIKPAMSNVHPYLFILIIYNLHSLGSKAPLALHQQLQAGQHLVIRDLLFQVDLQILNELHRIQAGNALNDKHQVLLRLIGSFE